MVDDPDTVKRVPLARSIGGLGYFVLSFGCIVGSGWVVALGGWVGAAGPGGAVLAFLAGGLLMALIAAAYAELLARLPRAGSEFSFIWNGIGPNAGFLTGWFIILHLASFTAFEAFALSWFVETLAPAFAGDPLYVSLGMPVTLPNLALGLAGTLLIGWFNSRGSSVAVHLQRIITFGFILVSALLVGLGFLEGSAANLTPFFLAPAGSSLAHGIFWTFATSLLFLSGFQSAANAIEERRAGTSMTGVARAIIGGVVAAAIFYAAIIVAASLLLPWQQLVGMPLPAAAAFRDVLAGGLATKLVLVAAIISLAKTWNALHLSASRLVMALARERCLPAFLAQVDPVHGVPRRAVWFVALCTLLWLGLGRGAILPIINMCTICITLIMVATLAALWRMRRRQGDRAEFQLPGGTPLLAIAMAGALLAAGVATVAAFEEAGGVPLEIGLIGIWGAIGLALCWARSQRHVG